MRHIVDRLDSPPYARRAVLASHWFVSIPLLMVCACNFPFEIDVCERQLADEIVVNQLTDGNQSVNHPRAIIGLPDGTGTMIYFSSDVAGSPNYKEVRTSHLDPSGLPVRRPCGSMRTDATLLAPDSSEPFDQYLGAAAVAPQRQDASGFLHVIRWIGTGSYATEGRSQLLGRALDESGCPEADVEPTIIADESGRFFLSHVGVNLGTAAVNGNGRVALFWLVCDVDPPGWCDFRGRVVELMYPNPRFLGVVEPATGDLVPSGRAVRIFAGNARSFTNLSATLTSEGIVLIWNRFETGLNGTTGMRIESMLLDNTFRVLRGVQTVYRRDGLHETSFPQIDLAFDAVSETALLLFPDTDDEGNNRRMGLTLGADGLAKPGATPFFTTDESGEEESSTAVALPGEGFFIVVEKEDLFGNGIVGVAVDLDGNPMFLNPSCDASTFVINTTHQGPQQLPSVARLTDGSVQVVWWDQSESFGDPSDSAVRGRWLGRRDLFPME